MIQENNYIELLYNELQKFDGIELIEGIEFYHDECAGSFFFDGRLNMNCSPAWDVFMNDEVLGEDNKTNIMIECGEGDAELSYVLTRNLKVDVENYFSILQNWLTEQQ